MIASYAESPGLALSARRFDLEKFSLGHFQRTTSSTQGLSCLGCLLIVCFADVFEAEAPNFLPFQGVGGRGGGRLQSRTSAERRKMTVVRAFFRAKEPGTGAVRSCTPPRLPTPIEARQQELPSVRTFPERISFRDTFRSASGKLPACSVQVCKKRW